MPPGQGFRPDDFAVGSTNLGLEDKYDLPAVQAVLKVTQDPVLFRASPVELRIVKNHAGMNVAVQAFRRERRMVVILHDPGAGTVKTRDSENR